MCIIVWCKLEIINLECYTIVFPCLSTTLTIQFPVLRNAMNDIKTEVEEMNPERLLPLKCFLI